MKWLDIPSGEKYPIIPASGAEFFWHDDDVYRERYSKDFIDRGKSARYVTEIFSEFEEDCSVLVFGAGHPFHCNHFNRGANIDKIVALDLYEEAGVGLDKDIDFIEGDFLIVDIPVVDYIFASHVIEHFRRDIIMNVILPKCLYHARKAVVFVTPYSSNNEREHKVYLTEHDELAGKAVKYKHLRPEGEELVLWFAGEYKDA